MTSPETEMPRCRKNFAMSKGIRESTPWLPVNVDTCQTVIEGAEVVRTAAVSYATPILHQVYIKGAAPSCRVAVAGSQPCTVGIIQNHFSTNVASTDDDKFSSVGLSPSYKSTTDRPRPINIFKKKAECLNDRSSYSETSQICLSSSIKLPASFTSSSLLSKSPLHFSEPFSSCQSVWSSSLSSELTPCSLTLPLSSSFNISLTNAASSIVSSSPTIVPPSISLQSSMSLPSSPSSPPVNYSTSPPLTLSRSDDELTSLSWLQDSNLLKGTALTSIKPTRTPSFGGSIGERKRLKTNRKDKDEAMDLITTKASEMAKPDTEDDCKVDSPLGDDADETNDGLDHPDVGQNAITQPVPYNPKIHTMAKPPFSFSCLIFMAIEESSSKALPVKDIYTWIVDHYPYYKSAPTGWKNSVRHNLSLNKCFAKVEKSPSLGKGSLWMVDPNHRPNLLQAMSKSPFSSMSPLDRSYTLSSKSVVNSDWQFNLNKTHETEEKSSLKDISHQTTEEIVQNGAEVLCSMNRKSSSPKLRIPTRQYHRNTSHDNYKLNQSIHSNNNNNNNNHDHVSNNNIFAPNPELFPRLARRLELNSLYETHLNSGSYAIDVQIEDVDAATAMLVLKHGPRMLSPLSESCIQYRKNQAALTDTFPIGVIEKRRKEKYVESSIDDPRNMYISSSPSMDHSYVSPPEDKNSEGSLLNGIKHTSTGKPVSSLSSIDNVYYEDENRKSLLSENGYSEHPFEEANALLNLASVATSLASKRDESLRESPSKISYSNESHSFVESQLESQTKTSTKNSTSVVNKQNLSTKDSTSAFNSFLSTKLCRSKTKMFSLKFDGELNTKALKVAKSSSFVGHSRFNINKSGVNNKKCSVNNNKSSVNNNKSSVNNNKSSANNNKSSVLNRNKFLKVKKLRLRRHKAC